MSKKKFDVEFKFNAVNLVKTQGLSVRQVSQDLGIGQSTLDRWVREVKASGNNSFPGSGRLKPAEERIRQLERSNEVLRRERDILKKALAIFSLP